MEKPKIKSISIDLIKPYWRNPRNTHDGVDAVAESIKEFGYQQPIVVDKEDVIIVGHTRYQALRKLGYTKIDVLVADMPLEQVREYRIVDNRTGELAFWDMTKLISELNLIGDYIFKEYFFPEIDTSVLDDIEEAVAALPEAPDSDDSDEDGTSGDSIVKVCREVECPYCDCVFTVD